MILNILPWLFFLQQISDPKLPMVVLRGVNADIGDVRARMRDVHGHRDDVHVHTSDVYLCIHHGDVRIHDDLVHHRDRGEVVGVEVHDLRGVYEYLEYLSP